jgi:hypothetical protein
MGTLGIIMMNLKNELLQKFGYNRIWLQEVMNSDTTMYISMENGLTGGIFGQVVLTENGWELVGYDLELFKSHLDFYNERKEEIHSLV